MRDAQCGYGCVNNSAAEITAMSDYPHMRLSQNTDGGSKVPLAESGNTGWMTPEKMGGKFSATCWFTFRDVYAALESPRPIGLIETNVGGTPDQHWSSPEALGTYFIITSTFLNRKSTFFRGNSPSFLHLQ